MSFLPVSRAAPIFRAINVRYVGIVSNQGGCLLPKINGKKKMTMTFSYRLNSRYSVVQQSQGKDTVGYCSGKRSIIGCLIDPDLAPARAKKYVYGSWFKRTERKRRRLQAEIWNIRGERHKRDVRSDSEDKRPQEETQNSKPQVGLKVRRVSA